MSNYATGLGILLYFVRSASAQFPQAFRSFPLAMAPGELQQNVFILRDGHLGRYLYLRR